MKSRALGDFIHSFDHILESIKYLTAPHYFSPLYSMTSVAHYMVYINLDTNPPVLYSFLS
jgi:hypothetical protein